MEKKKRKLKKSLVTHCYILPFTILLQKLKHTDYQYFYSILPCNNSKKIKLKLFG